MSIQKIGVTPQFSKPSFKAKLDVSEAPAFVDELRTQYRAYPNEIKKCLDNINNQYDDSVVLKLKGKKYNEHSGEIEKAVLTNPKTGFQHEIDPMGCRGMIGILQHIDCLLHISKEPMFSERGIYPAESMAAKKLVTDAKILDHEVFQDKLKIGDDYTKEFIIESDIINRGEDKKIFDKFNQKFNDTKMELKIENQYDSANHNDRFCVKISDSKTGKTWASNLEYSKERAISNGLNEFINEGYKKLFDIKKHEDILKHNVFANNENYTDVLDNDVFAN